MVIIVRPGPISLITLMLVGVRTTGAVTWPWWAVTAPAWGFLAAGSAYMLARSALDRLRTTPRTADQREATQ